MKSLCAVLVCLFLCSPSFGESLEHLEAITARARTLDEFLGDAKLIDEYYGALQRYYGEGKIRREEFDAIIAGVGKMSATVEGFGARAWETTGLGEPYTMSNVGKSRPRGLDKKAWRTYLDGLRSSAPELVSAIEGSKPCTEAVTRGDADALLFLIGRMPTKPRGFSVDSLGANAKIFPPTYTEAADGGLVPLGGTPAGDYVFKPIPRRFHGIWKGLPLKECVRTNCARWSTALIADSRLYHVERNGSYLGFVHLVPMFYSPTGVTYASVDLGAPVMQGNFGSIGEDGAVRFVPFRDAWLAEARRHFPAGWKGIAFGDTMHINNAGVRGLLDFRDFAAVYRSDLSLNDPLAERIVAASGAARLRYEVNESWMSAYVTPAPFGREETRSRRCRSFARIAVPLALGVVGVAANQYRKHRDQQRARAEAQKRFDALLPEEQSVYRALTSSGGPTYLSDTGAHRVLEALREHADASREDLYQRLDRMPELSMERAEMISYRIDDRLRSMSFFEQRPEARDLRGELKIKYARLRTRDGGGLSKDEALRRISEKMR